MTIQRIVAAAVELQDRLGPIGLPFCFIGGLAVQRWGEPRLTVDADAVVLSGIDQDERLVDSLLAQFSPRRKDARDFALAHRVLLLQASDGTRLDVSLGAIPFEARVMTRSSDWQYAEQIAIRTCSPEDLVILKTFAGRDRDWLDIEGVLIRQGARLDATLILAESSPLLDLKEDLAALPRLESLLRKYVRRG